MASCTLPLGVAESLMKGKDLPEWEVDIEGSNVKDHELRKGYPFGIDFTIWLSV